MRQAAWEEMFQPAEEPPKESRLAFLARIISWEDLVTLAIVLIAFLIVVGSINSADWVSVMPSLFPIAFAGLGVGLVLARLGLGEVKAHFIALVVGVVSVTISATSRLDGSLIDRVEAMGDRMWIWSKAVYEGGISNDNLPFVVVVVGLTYIAAYLAAWSLFRWYNAWLALIPGGIALLTNISYLPGQSSTTLLIFLFCSILLIARINLLRRARTWRQERSGYPDFLSLHVLNVTVWVALLLLAMAWMMPIGSGSGALFTFWQKITAPIVEPLSDLGRVFTAVDSKKGGGIHKFGSTLPLQGAITLGSTRIASVTTTEPVFLRAQSYDFYTAQGWKIGSDSQLSGDLDAFVALQSAQEAGTQLRRPISILVTVADKASVILSAGQPLAVSIESRIAFGLQPSDVTSIRPTKTLEAGLNYRVDGMISNASIESLQGAGEVYPGWIAPYLQLPSDLPPEINTLALEITAGATTVFDKAELIEEFLRTFAIDTRIDAAPPDGDSVAYFLFDAKRGYFDYHASAMIVMLRTLGVPSRLAAGYIITPEDREPGTNEFTITGGHSFAWPEVFFPGLGWIEFNPTPSEARVLRTGTDQEEFFVDPLEELFLQGGLLPGEVRSTSGPAAEGIDRLTLEDEQSNIVSRVVITVILLFLGITAVGGGIFHYTWQHGLSDFDYPVQIWEKTLRLARWARIPIAPQETPRELTTRLQQELSEVEDLDFVGESYIRSRYGHKELSPEEKERLTAVWKKTRGSLFGRILRWK